MRACLISDVHGNLHALEAVLAAVAQEAPDEIWCLGDLTGYGPQPSPCCSRVRERATLSLVGNHDLGVLGQLDLDDFSPDAAASARWTRSVLAPAERSWLESLAPCAERDGVGLYHASPRDPVWEYVLSSEIAEASLFAAPEPLVLVGHSHVALAFARHDERLSGGVALDGTELDLASADRWLLNPGSVGQPRDGDPRAAYVVLDL
ncbi:MAG: metallophosphoesterase family protein, partial [Thermoleophilia bacterium]|nr:metallophosphoesterase family protein [Thermoleophilia bacterium]